MPSWALYSATCYLDSWTGKYVSFYNSWYVHAFFQLVHVQAFSVMNMVPGK